MEKRTQILITAILASFSFPVMVSALGVALPRIGETYGILAGDLGLVETAYLAASLMFMLPFGKLADKVGLDRIYLLGMILSTLSTLLLSMAPNYPTLIGLRFFQGMAASMQMATGIAILSNAYPKEERGKVLGIAIGAIYIGAAIGPYLGGYLTDHYSWKAIFMVGSGISALATLLAFNTLSLKKKAPKGKPFDLKAALAYSGLILSIWGGFTYGSRSQYLFLVAGGGLVGAYFFLRKQLHSRNPIIDIRLFVKNQEFRWGTLLTFMNYSASMAIVFTLSLFLQYIKKLTAYEAGVVLLCMPVIQSVLAPMAGKLSDRFDKNLMVFLGMSSGFIGLVLTLFLNEATPLWGIYMLLGFFGLGFALFSSANMNQVLSSVEPSQTGVASGFVGTMRIVGMLTSITVASAAFGYFVGDQKITAATEGLFLQGVQFSFGVFLFISMYGLSLAYRLLRLERKSRTLLMN